MVLIKLFLTGTLYDRFKLTYGYLHEADKVPECYSCLKLIIHVHLSVDFYKKCW